MAVLSTQLLENLHSLSDEDLDEITADGHTFARTQWYRLLDSLPLDSIIGGQVRMQYAVVRHGDCPICVTPILRSTGAGVYFAYSLRRYYFEHWIEEAVRLQPEKQQTFARLMTMVSGYRKLLEWSGTKLSDCLIVTGPMSYRGEIPVAPSSPVPRHQVYAALVRDLQKYSRRHKLPLWFFALQGGSGRLAKVLDAAQCSRSFLFYDNCLNLEEYRSFDDYLRSFRRTTRRAFCRDLKRIEEAGIQFRFLSDWSGLEPTLTGLYTQTYSKYGSSFFRHGDQFWSMAQQHLGDQAEIIVAERDQQLLGFSLLMHNVRRGEMWTYRIGRSFSDDLESVPFYFGLSFYGPIQRAIERGYRRIWLGPASYEAKSVRGAEQVPLYSYFWFPRRWDRWFLRPYLQMFGQISQEEIVRSLQRPVRTGQPSTTVRNTQGR